MTAGTVGDASWGWSSVAGSIAECTGRRRCSLVATVAAVALRYHHGPCVEVTVDDRTGTLVARFLGRDTVPGFHAGVGVALQGTVIDEWGTLVVLNPTYQFTRSHA
jgi:hypothetical protein